MNRNKKRQYSLKNIPEDVWLFIKEEQHRRELQCKCSESFEKTIYEIVKEYKSLKENDAL